MAKTVHILPVSINGEIKQVKTTELYNYKYAKKMIDKWCEKSNYIRTSEVVGFGSFVADVKPKPFDLTDFSI